MNKKLWIILLIIAVVVVSAIVIGKKKQEDTVAPSSEEVQTGTQTSSSAGKTTGSSKSTGTTGSSTSSPSGSSQSVNFTLSSPLGGERFNVGEVITIAWNVVPELSTLNTTPKVAITLLHDGKEVAQLTEKNGVSIADGRLRWKIPNVSLWGEEGFSVRAVTTGLSRNFSVQSGTFTIATPSANN